MPEFRSDEPASSPLDELLPDQDLLTRPASSADTRSSLRSGDLVVVNRPSVNGRAWMSTVAPILTVLKEGTQAALLSDPMRSEGQLWVKLRPVEETTVYCVSTRFLELVTPRSEALPLDSPTNIGWLTAGTSFLPGDRITTILLLNMRSDAGIDHPVVRRIPQNSMGIVRSDPRTVGSLDWVDASFGKHRGWVSTGFIRPFARGGKWIEVDIASQRVIAWWDDSEVWQARVSTGKPGFRTPTGTFTISKKFPTRRTRATVRDEHWDIPGVPWIMVFRSGGYYFHGVYWHDDFGSPVSHGCVTLAVPQAEWLYDWTPPGTPVWIHA